MIRAIAPGWCPDPQGSGHRYWDGQAWGPHAPQPSAYIPPLQPAQRQYVDALTPSSSWSSTPGSPVAQTPEVAPAGWHADPDRSGGQRWWDGQSWTTHRHQVSKVKGFWAGLPTMGRVALVAAPIVVIFMAIIAAGASSGNSVSHRAGAEAGFSGRKGDRDARAYWEDTGRLLNDPASFAQVVCRVRASGASEDQAIDLNVTGLHGEHQRDVNDQDVLFIVAAEYHFCPQYYR
jgi:Protein of unknown function (DUF2510)/Protein of unknown function (DUF732)